MIIMTYDEALEAFEKEVETFKQIDKNYLLRSNDFFELFSRTFSEQRKKFDDSYRRLKARYTKEQLYILDECRNFPEVFSISFEKQKSYKKQVADMDIAVKKAVLPILCQYTNSNIGKVFVYVLVFKANINKLETIKETMSFIDKNFEDLISLIKKPIAKTLMYGEKFKLRPTDNYSKAIQMLTEKIPSNCVEYEVLCKKEIQHYLYNHPEMERNILLNLPEKSREIFIEYFGLKGTRAKTFDQIAFMKCKALSVIQNDFARGLRMYRGCLRK